MKPGSKLTGSPKSERYVNDESRPEGSGFQRLLLTRPFVTSGRAIFNYGVPYREGFGAAHPHPAQQGRRGIGNGGRGSGLSLPL
jgi:hypothetical protein